jgi:hypothetical protein
MYRICSYSYPKRAILHVRGREGPITPVIKENIQNAARALDINGDDIEMG